jgi:putative transposase
MMMVLADGKHFRAGVRRRKHVALFFLDGAPRYELGVLVGTEANQCCSWG